MSSPPDLLVSAAAPPRHAVQFYEDDHFLIREVARFLAAGLSQGQPAVVIATSWHREAIANALRLQGFDVASLQGDTLVLLDAEDTLALFMGNEGPDAARFASHIGGVLDRVQGGRTGVTTRAYGEMVDVLWQQGRSDAALQLEQFWNDLAASHSFSLLCGYAMGNFREERHAREFLETCRLHTHVRPTEHYLLAQDEEARRREISWLQQRSRALENEIEVRRALEVSLRRALVERERAEEERGRLLVAEQKARAEAETANHLKDEFLALLSHELRTPLNAILGWTRIATDPRTEMAMLQRALDVIHRNARLQVHLIDDLLDVSRILTGKLRISTDAVDLVQMAMTAVDGVRPGATAKDIALTLYVDAASPSLIVTGDANRLQQVMWNLLSNAVKFTPNHGRVDMTIGAAGERARLVVRDTGQGIAPEFLPHVFERFRQAETGTTRTHSGLGLGLAVVQYLVEAHGGQVAADSDGEGQGATFTVTLPLASKGQDPVLPHVQREILGEQLDDRGTVSIQE
jgi:signal transduction histidine kinase